MDILMWIAIFMLGFSLGYLVKILMTNRISTSGIIRVTHSEEKTLYSLELNEYPDAIDFKDRVVFKVERSEEES